MNENNNNVILFVNATDGRATFWQFGSVDVNVQIQCCSCALLFILG